MGSELTGIIFVIGVGLVVLLIGGRLIGWAIGLGEMQKTLNKILELLERESRIRRGD